MPLNPTKKKSFTISEEVDFFPKNHVLDVWLGSEYSSNY